MSYELTENNGKISLEEKISKKDLKKVKKILEEDKDKEISREDEENVYIKTKDTMNINDSSQDFVRFVAHNLGIPVTGKKSESFADLTAVKSGDSVVVKGPDVNLSFKLADGFVKVSGDVKGNLNPKDSDFLSKMETLILAPNSEDILDSKTADFYALSLLRDLKKVSDSKVIKKSSIKIIDSLEPKTTFRNFISDCCDMGAICTFVEGLLKQSAPSDGLVQINGININYSINLSDTGEKVISLLLSIPEKTATEVTVLENEGTPLVNYDNNVSSLETFKEILP